MPTEYLIEYAKSGRAKCRGPCKGVIQAELSFGWLAADSAGNEFFLWKHFPGCLGASYAAQANAARKAVERYGSAAAVPGLECLDNGDRAYAIEVLEALVQGHALPEPPAEAEEPEVPVAPAPALKKRKSSSGDSQARAAPGEEGVEGEGTLEGVPEGMAEGPGTPSPSMKTSRGKGRSKKKAPAEGEEGDEEDCKPPSVSGRKRSKAMAAGQQLNRGAIHMFSRAIQTVLYPKGAR